MTFSNLSAMDRLVRLALGLLMLVAGWSGWVPGVWAVGLKVFAWVPLITALIGWCPFYALLGIRTGRGPSAGRSRN